jgi:hypothetical protein
MNITIRHFLRSAGIAAVALACGVTVASAQVIIERGVMPQLRIEVIPAAPSVEHHWVPGHWAWRGHWEWIPGHHVRGVVPGIPVEVVEVVPARPAAEYYWVKGHHVWEGDRWVWRRGVWVR